MKKYIVLLCISALTTTKMTLAQKKSWFDKNVLIGQSMETAEQKKEPAQFQITLPHKDSSSWLLDIGVSVKLGSQSPRLISKLTTEFHKNTLTDEKQNNFSLGYSYKYLIPGGKTTDWFSVGDIKYVYDGEKIKNSVAANLLFTFSNDESKFLHWNANKYFNKAKQAIFLSIFGGVQIQDILKAKNDSAKGFIVRPIFTPTFILDFNSAKDSSTVLRFSATYTGRKDMVNSTKFAREDYTHLLKAGAEIFLAYKPVKVSLGFSFNYGSDPLKGLKQQQYWLFAINLQK